MGYCSRGVSGTGADEASARIARLNSIAVGESLPITGVTADILTDELDCPFDKLPIDGTLHKGLDLVERHAKVDLVILLSPYPLKIHMLGMT